MFRNRKEKPKLTLRIIPLIDTIFILFVFFVVSASFSKLPGISVNQPEAITSDKIPADNLLIGINQDGDLYINKKPIKNDQLKITLINFYQKNPKLSILIMTDKETPIKHAIFVMDICKQLGINNIAIAERIIK